MNDNSSDNLDQALADYERMWTTERDDWVVCRVSAGRWLPLQLSTQSALVIEDDELATAVAARMLEGGIPVVDRPPWFPHEPADADRRDIMET